MGFDTGPFVNVAIFCERAILDNEGVLTLVRLTDQITIRSSGPQAPEELPAGTVVQTTLVIVLKPGEARGNQGLRIDIEEPTGQVRPGPEMSVPFAGGPSQGANIVLPMVLQVESAGLYWANVYIAGRVVTRVPLQITYQYLRAPGQGVVQ